MSKDQPHPGTPSRLRPSRPNDPFHQLIDALAEVAAADYLREIACSGAANGTPDENHVLPQHAEAA